MALLCAAAEGGAGYSEDSDTVVFTVEDPTRNTLLY